MSKESFDLDKLRELMELMEKHEVTEINLRHGEEQWRMRRGQEIVQAVAPVALPPAAAAPVAAAPAAAPAGEAPAAAPAAIDGVVIKSPTVGTFYSSPSPEDPPFVSVGDRVDKETIVCIVEAMKVFNNIPAEVNGTIAEVLVENGDSVEFGQPLYRVTPG